MRIHVTGRPLDVGKSLRGHFETQLGQSVDKCLSRPVEAGVSVGREGQMYRCECMIHADRGLDLRAGAKAGAADAPSAKAMEKLEKQLRRYGRRIKDHHALKPAEHLAPLSARSYVERSEPETEAVKDSDMADADKSDQPLMIAKASMTIPQECFGDAVTLMTVTESPALKFHDSKSDERNMVYRRAIGNTGWIDPVSLTAP